MPRFELHDDSSDKFWQIDIDGSSLTTTWGKVGTNGQSKTKSFASSTKAQSEYDKLLKEKVGKGYVAARREGGASASSAKKRGAGAGTEKTLPQWLAVPGARFEYEMADFDANDTYVLGIDKAGKSLTWSWDGAGDEGSVTASAPSLAKGGHIAFISQGTVMPDDDATPPFLISRQAAKRLAAGESASLAIYGAQSDLEKTGNETLVIEIGGEKIDVAVVHASGDDLEIWFVDNAEWPVLVRAEFQGDNEISLKSVRVAE